MPAREQIALFKGPAQRGSDRVIWFARTDDPATEELFGTGVLPTAFMGAMPGAEVLERIRELNPEADVVLADERTVK